MVTPCFPPSKGGIETAVYQLSMRLTERGHDVHVVTTRRGISRKYNEEMHNGFKVSRCDERYFGGEVPFNPEIVRYITNIDKGTIVHIHGMTPGVSDFALAVKLLRRENPFVLTYHCDPVFEPFPALSTAYCRYVRWIVGLADRIVATSWDYATTSPVIRPFIEKVTIIPWGVDSTYFTPNGVDEQPNKQILFVGQLKRYKGLTTLIDALKLILANNNNVQLTIVGFGPLWQTLKDYAGEIGVADHIIFTGTISDEALLRYYAKCDVCVLPSLNRREAFGLVLFEAMSSGKPVIASNIPGVRSIIPTDCGFLVPPGDSESLATALNRILFNNGLAKKMGLNARSYIERNHNWERVVECYEQVYKEVSNSLQGEVEVSHSMLT